MRGATSHSRGSTGGTLMRAKPLPAVGVADGDRQRQRQVADVRERVRGIDRERRQDREDLVQEALAQLELALRAVV